MSARRPVIWSIAGTDSGGGAGLAADQRAADAFGVHLCGVVAAVTAQNSRAVTHVEPLPVELLEAQLGALARDMPPCVVKTGLLGGAQQVRCVARWIDRLRERGPVALVVDPVLGASSGGAEFADAATVQAYREDLLPRASVITPNRHEARRLLDRAGGDAPNQLPSDARALRERGPAVVCITGGDSADVDGRALDWLDGPRAQGWLAAPRVATHHSHGSGCTFASSLAAALTLGFVAEDAAVLAKMATTHALRRGYAAGTGPGPVQCAPGFAADPTLLPLMSFGESPRFAVARAGGSVPLALYAIVDDARRVAQVLAAGLRTVQLRIKRPAHPDAAWLAHLRQNVRHSAAACRDAGALLFVNDHWALAQECGAGGVHLGQEDLLALGDAGRDALAASGLALGISSHSLWELARAKGLAPRYIACGPVWPTLTKVMPWLPQREHNLAWWCRMAGTPVVAIGGILSASAVTTAARCGAAGVCLVRVLGNDPIAAVPGLQAAFEAAAALPSFAAPAMPCPSLPTPSSSG